MSNLIILYQTDHRWSALRKLLEILREDDTVIVWKLDRLGRSLKELFTLVNDFQI
ncbi:recombinase family protein [Spirosoma radiotolerans]|uniref:recombinase family protein n=1 Tax=Spirosoma radiotolerans TaxID=1379870 RepID=UPI00373FC656